jgi:hypothetical protein
MKAPEDMKNETRVSLKQQFVEYIRRGAIGQEITHHKEFGERLFAWGVLVKLCFNFNVPNKGYKT